MPARIAAGALAVLLSFDAVADERTFERALSLAAEKRYAEAREVLDAVLDREPDHVDARLLHGVLHARGGRPGEAIEIFEALRREHPEMVEPYNNLAVLYALEGRLEEARETLLAILERHPDPVAYANLGDVYTKLARSAYERARELDAGHGGSGTGEVETALEAPSSAQGSPGIDFDGDGPGTRTLAMESAEAVTKPAGAGKGDTETPAPSAVCARAGGFEGRRVVAEAALWLQSRGAEVLEVRRDEGEGSSGPWRVYLPPFASREEAQAKLREIRSRGVRDIAVIRDGELANGVSFGVYRETANVQRRVAALERLGYAVRSQATEGAPVGGYAIEVRTRGAVAGFEAAGFEAEWASRFPERPLQVVDCR